MNSFRLACVAMLAALASSASAEPVEPAPCRPGLIGPFVLVRGEPSAQPTTIAAVHRHLATLAGNAPRRENEGSWDVFTVAAPSGPISGYRFVRDSGGGLILPESDCRGTKAQADAARAVAAVTARLVSDLTRALGPKVEVRLIELAETPAAKPTGD